MALINPETGESVLDGTGVHVVLTVEAWLWIERRLGLTILEVLERAMQLRFGIEHTVVILWAGAEAWRRRYAVGSPVFTEEQAAKVFEQAGGLVPVMKVLAEAIRHSSALGMPVGGEEAGVPEAPADAPFSTGTPSASVRSITG